MKDSLTAVSQNFNSQTDVIKTNLHKAPFYGPNCLMILIISNLYPSSAKSNVRNFHRLMMCTAAAELLYILMAVTLFSVPQLMPGWGLRPTVFNNWLFASTSYFYSLELQIINSVLSMISQT